MSGRSIVFLIAGRPGPSAQATTSGSAPTVAGCADVSPSTSTVEILVEEGGGHGSDPTDPGRAHPQAGSVAPLHVGRQNRK